MSLLQQKNVLHCTSKFLETIVFFIIVTLFLNIFEPVMSGKCAFLSQFYVSFRSDLLEYPYCYYSIINNININIIIYYHQGGFTVLAAEMHFQGIICCFC